jgi:hypothetical protein
MASMSDFRRIANDVRNWGRWGDTDELGTLNFITAEKVAEAASLVKHGKVFPLGVDFGSSGPQCAFHFRQNPLHVMTIDGGDAATLLEYGPKWLQNPAAGQLAGYFEGNPMRFNDDIIIMPLQAATQWMPLARLLRGLPLQRLPEPAPARARSTAGSTRSTARASRHGRASRPTARCGSTFFSWKSITQTNSTRRRPKASHAGGDIVLVEPVGGQVFGNRRRRQTGGP